MIEEIIRSKENKIFKKISSLENKKYRDKYNSYLLEGTKLVFEALETKDVELVVLRENKRKIYDQLREYEDYEGRFVFMEGKLFDKLTRTQTSQGVFAIAKKPKFSQDDFIAKAERKNIVVLDRLQDPGNIGTIIRTALAAGYGGCIVIKGSADIYSPKIVRASSNALLRLPIYLAENEDEVLEICNKLKVVSLGADLKGCDYESLELDEKNLAIIIGNEGKGISHTLLEKTDVKVKIPMSEHIESLNAAVAAAILIYKWKGI